MGDASLWMGVAKMFTWAVEAIALGAALFFNIKPQVILGVRGKKNYRSA